MHSTKTKEEFEDTKGVIRIAYRKKNSLTSDPYRRNIYTVIDLFCQNGFLRAIRWRL